MKTTTKKKKKRNIPIPVFCTKCLKEFKLNEQDFTKETIDRPLSKTKISFICPYCHHKNYIN